MRTLLQLMQDIEFVDSGNTVTAKLDGAVVGKFAYPSRKDLDVFKQELLKALAWRTSTIVLKTRCGCTRIIEKHEANYSYLVPLLGKSSYLIPNNFSEASTYTKREFKYRNRHDSDTGCRLFEEVE